MINLSFGGFIRKQRWWFWVLISFKSLNKPFFFINFSGQPKVSEDFILSVFLCIWLLCACPVWLPREYWK